jgi:hypothetical protein
MATSGLLTATTLEVGVMWLKRCAKCSLVGVQRESFQSGANTSNKLLFIFNWGVVQLVGHLTVNEDGEGSNPSAPAKFAALIRGRAGLLLAPLRRKACVAPAFPAAIHRFHIGVTHFLEALRH